MSGNRKTYSEEFKREAVRLFEKTGNRSRVARDLGIHKNLLRKWEHQIKLDPERPFPGRGNPHDVELHRLKKENARLKEELEILKKAVGIFSNRPQ